MVRLVMSYKLGGIWRETVVAKYCLEWQRKITKSCQDIWYRTEHLSNVSLRAYLAVQPYSVPAGTIKPPIRTQNDLPECCLKSELHIWPRIEEQEECDIRELAIRRDVWPVCRSQCTVSSPIWYSVAPGFGSFFWSLRPHFSPILENCCPSRHWTFSDDRTASATTLTLLLFFLENLRAFSVLRPAS